MINRCPSALKATYMRMLATIGKYNVSPEEVRLLFELAMPRAAEPDTGPVQVRLSGFRV